MDFSPEFQNRAKEGEFAALLDGHYADSILLDRAGRRPVPFAYSGTSSASAVSWSSDCPPVRRRWIAPCTVQVNEAHHPPAARSSDMSAQSPEHDPDTVSSQGLPTDDPPADDRSASERSVDDLTSEDLAEDVIALTEERATRGPFRPTTPRAGEEEKFAEGPEGEPVDPVYRAATPEIDLYEDLPSRRARAEPEEATEDAASPEAEEGTRN